MVTLPKIKYAKNAVQQEQEISTISKNVLNLNFSGYSVSISANLLYIPTYFGVFGSIYSAEIKHYFMFICRSHNYNIEHLSSADTYYPLQIHVYVTAHAGMHGPVSRRSPPARHRRPQIDPDPPRILAAYPSKYLSCFQRLVDHLTLLGDLEDSGITSRAARASSAYGIQACLPNARCNRPRRH